MFLRTFDKHVRTDSDLAQWRPSQVQTIQRGTPSGQPSLRAPHVFHE